MLTLMDTLPSTKPYLLNFTESTMNLSTSVEMPETMEDITLKTLCSTLWYPQIHNHITIKDKLHLTLKIPVICGTI